VKANERIFVKFGNVWHFIKCKVFLICIIELQEYLRSFDIVTC
jgi:hypothetical protein